tara:strand:- start:109 stop:300 length:192 start_codon:yes stop_codon:yes gene_type:complete
MELLKQKLKTKKYQYLYLQEKLNTLVTEETLHDVGHGGFSPIFNRVSFYYDWLEKINKKYNYA